MSQLSPFEDDECFNIKKSRKIRPRSQKTLIMNYLLTLSIYSFMHNFVFPSLRNSHSCQIMIQLSQVLVIASIALTAYLSNINPGFVEQNSRYGDDNRLLFLLIKYDPESLCPDCQVIRTTRSRHCNKCN